MERATEYFKNFASVIMWSTGNESGHGTNHVEMIRYLRKWDPSRLVHCEDATHKGEFRNADVYSRMYTSLEGVEKAANSYDIDMPMSPGIARRCFIGRSIRTNWSAMGRPICGWITRFPG